MYVCYLTGNNVFRTFSIQCIIPTLHDLPAARDYIRSRCEIEFEKENVSLMKGIYVYRNTSDNRDITLIVEHYNVVRGE